MNFFSKLFHSRDKPQNYISSHLSFLFGQTAAGQKVNECTAMQVTAVYACVRILAEAIAGLPLSVYRYTESGSKEKVLEVIAAYTAVHSFEAVMPISARNSFFSSGV